MRIVRIILATAFLWLICAHTVKSQDVPVRPSMVGQGEFHGITPPLRDLPVLTPEEYAIMKAKAEKKLLNKKLRVRSYPFADQALPKGPDPIWQTDMGRSPGSRAPLVNFDGQTSPYYPPDANGTAGPNHYMQTINTVYAIYNKSGTLVAGPTNMNLLFSGVTGSNCNDGDPLILYDEQAGRWLAVEFSLCNANNYMLVAVSTTNDPTGTWYKYSFDVDDMPDYEKFGIWQDGYYMGANNDAGKDIYVFERSQMLIGGASPKMVGFDNSWRPTTIDGFVCVPPVDNDGDFAPAGSPGLFIAFNDDAIGGGSDQLWIYELAVNWTTPASSTFNRSQQLTVPSFDSNFGNTWENIPQAGTSQKLDAIPQVIMNIPQYRNFGSYQTLVCCHTVDVDNSDHAGVRWYELRKTSGSWSLRQSGTYAPDAHSRWMGSIALNGSGQLGVGYSVSSSSMNPAIRYCGQSSGAYASATGVLDIPEESIQAGSYSQTGAERWGDYACISLDPTDDKTFWFTSEYIGSGGTRKTKIASFKFGNSPTVVTLAATAITGSSATLNGTVNPNGLSTTYYFQWGTTNAYGNTTTSTSAGSGSGNVSVSAGITGLSAGTTYHFRLVGVNADGTTNGSDMTFAPGGAILTTTPASAIGMSTATSGGNITSDGGSAITARGVCWSTTSNPVFTGDHTTDGSGIGTFISSITGLAANTTYHVRAYATNSGGTFYGEDLQFTTLCGTITSFPWNEGFENGGLIPNCWTQEQVSSSGIYWTFITGNGGSNPATAHGGTYNACLQDETSANNKTRLITPSINLTSVTNPQLKFWQTQAFWSPDQDQLAIYYKTSYEGTWTLITTYTNNITSWTQETINLPNPTSDYYIAFEGNAKWGYGVCLDDVSITGCTSVPVSVSINASANPVCAGNTVTYTATPVNGGTSPVYQWKVNGTTISGSTNATYSYVPANGDNILCVLTSNASCVSGNPATSNVISMVVYPMSTVSVSIVADANPVSSGTSVTFTATPVNGGSAPAYQWKVNGMDVSGAILSTYSYIPANNDMVTCVLTSNVACPVSNPAVSNTITMTVNQGASIAITSPNGGETWLSGTVHPITWTSLNVNNVKIEYSIDNGANWISVISSIAAVTGTYSWTVPNPVTNTPVVQCLVKITSTTDASVLDISNSDFSILNALKHAPITYTCLMEAGPGSAIAVPVMVDKFRKITAISLLLEYDPTVLTYTGYNNTNTALAGLIVNNVPVSPTLYKIIITWSDQNSATLTDASKIVDLLFDYSTGTTTLVWNNSSNNGQDCEYADSVANTLIDVPTSLFYINGEVDLSLGWQLNGAFVYNNESTTPLDNVKVVLFQNTIRKDSVTTNASGTFQFSQVQNGTYIVKPYTGKPWAGVNATDAVKIQRHFTGLELLTEPVRLLAADVNLSDFINTTDAVKVKRRFAMMDNSFDRGDWTFAKPATGGDTVVINNANLTRNFYGLCVGDVNGSNIPSPGKSLKQQVEIISEGIVEVSPGQVFELPVRVRNAMQLTAISLVIPYPEDLLEVKDVMMNQGTLLYNLIDGEIRIAWSEIQPLTLNAGDIMLILKLSAKEKFTGNKTIDLHPAIESELADGNGEAISAAALSILTIKPFNAYSIDDSNDLISFCKVYPNPAQDVLNIEIQLKSQADCGLQIIDATGKIVINIPGKRMESGTAKLKVYTSKLPDGLYSLKLSVNSEIGQKEYLHKIVINR